MPLVAQRRPDPEARKSKDPEDFRAPLHEHLDELRVRIFRSLGALIVGWIIGWPASIWLNKVLIELAVKAIKDGAPKGTGVNVSFVSATEAFMVLLRQSFVVGLCLALPFIVVQIWGFVAPGLKESEKRPVRIALPFSIGLFFMGVGFCYLILPNAFYWFAGFLSYFPTAELNQNPEQLITFAVKMMAAFGICFQLPLIVYVLGRVGILTPETLIRYWRQSVVCIFFIAAALTPSSDPISMMMMAVPLCVLFAISVYAVKITAPKSSFKDSEMPPLD